MLALLMGATCSTPPPGLRNPALHPDGPAEVNARRRNFFCTQFPYMKKKKSRLEQQAGEKVVSSHAWRGTWNRPVEVDEESMDALTTARMTDHNVRGGD